MAERNYRITATDEYRCGWERIWGRPPLVTVTINGVEHAMRPGEVTYEQIVALADLRGTPTVTWTGPPSPYLRDEGLLSPGQSMLARHGLRITCLHATRA